MQKALTNKPDPAHAGDAQKFLALTALSENPKDLVAAEAEIQKELQSNPEFVPALMAQAVLDAKQGQIKRATETYDKILHRWPEFALAQKRLAELYAQDPSTPRCGVRSCIKSAQDGVRRPWVNRVIGTIELRKERISPGCAVVTGDCTTTAVGRKFSFLSRNVPAPGQTDRRSARGAKSSFGWGS
jgi:tetratricopeptide (TPR) repeat protein